MIPASDLTKSAPSMAAIGEKLKKAREGKSLDIAQVQAKTRIHSTIISALEEGRCGNMLTPVYVKSFLKEYVRFLGLDQSEILKDYSTVNPTEARPYQSFNVNKVDSESSGDARIIFGIIKFIVITSIAVLISLFLWNKISEYTDDGKSSGKLSASAKSSSIPTRVRTNIRPRSDIADRQRTDAKQIASKQPTGVVKNKPFNMVLKVNESVWVEVSKDGLLLFKRFLPKGTVESYRANEKIVIFVAKAEAIEIVVNGRSLGSPGKGLVKNLEVTRSGIKSR